jgi:uncharacterized membrane protein YbaN (DUF454 family)
MLTKAFKAIAVLSVLTALALGLWAGEHAGVQIGLVVFGILILMAIFLWIAACLNAKAEAAFQQLH